MSYAGQKWEYRTETHNGPQEPWFLSMLGEQGWELMHVSVHTHTWEDRTFRDERYVFKRRKLRDGS